MKTRQGFVSNSSSSSFVVWFPKPIKSKDDLENAMFPNGRRRINYSWGSDTISAQDCLDELWHQIQNPSTSHVDIILDAAVVAEDDVLKEHKLVRENILDERAIVCRFHWICVSISLTGNETWWQSKLAEHYNYHLDGVCHIMIKHLQNRSSDVPYAFEFEDHNSVTRILENGDQFDHLKNQKESCH